MAASACHVIQKEVENRVSRHSRNFRHTSMYKQPISTKQQNYNNFVQILYSYLRYTDRLLDMFFLLLAVTLSELRESKKKSLNHRKQNIEEFVCRTSLIRPQALLLMSFLSLFSSTLSLSSTPILRRKKFCSRKWYGGLRPPVPPVCTALIKNALKIFSVLLYSVKSSPFSLNAMFESPKE